MYMFAVTGHPLFAIDTAATGFLVFGTLHLISTMFLTTDERQDPVPGVFHRVLDPLGQSDILHDVDKALEMPVGRTTLGAYIRRKRNRLAVHGDLAFTSQHAEVIEVTQSDEALDQYEAAMESLTAAVKSLHKELSER